MKKKLFLTALLSAFGAKADVDLKVGDIAPVAQAQSHLGEVVKLQDVYSRGKVLIFFYPKAFTPGCTKQACSLRDSYKILKEKGVEVFGVSTDSVEVQKKFHDEHKLPYVLLSDSKKEVANAFGVSSVFGLLDRQAFLIIDGKIAWLDRDASTEKQADDVLTFLNQAK